MLFLAIILGVCLGAVVIYFDALLEEGVNRKVIGWCGSAIILSIVVYAIKKIIEVPPLWLYILGIIPISMVIIAGIIFVWGLSDYRGDHRRRRRELEVEVEEEDSDMTVHVPDDWG